MGLGEIEATLPPGYRFYPSDEELVCYYLHKKVANESSPHDTMIVVDLHTCEPWQLPDAAKLSENEWYFFSFRNRKYATGVRANRATTSGYWKATGKDRAVINPTTQELAGMRKTLVFYLERAPTGKKTSWVMHEFRLENPYTAPKEEWVLCRVYNKSRGQWSKFSLVDEQDNAGPSSPFLEPPPSSIDHSMRHSYDQDRIQPFIRGSHKEDSDYPSTLQNSSVLPVNFLGFPDHEVDETASMMGLNERGGDDFGFLLDLGQDYQNMRGGGDNPTSGKERLEDVKDEGL